jgi:gluconolactonase
MQRPAVPLLLLLCLMAACQRPDPPTPAPLAETPILVKLAEVPGYTEGVVFDHAGDAYISDVYQGVVYRVTTQGDTTVWARTGAPNGHKVLPDSTHLLCDGSQHAVLHLDRDGNVLGKAADQYNGQPLRAPNDLTLDPAGGFYFTDPGDSGKENPIGRVYYVDPSGQITLVADSLAFPNGIVLRPDGVLLVGESHYNHILRYDVQAPGQVGPKQIFATLPVKAGEQIDNQPDGICLDEAGNLYVAHYGMRQVQVLGPDGQLLHRYPGGNLTTSNVAFGGPNRDQLYITGALGEERTTRGGLFRLDLPGVRGLPVIPTR